MNGDAHTLEQALILVVDDNEMNRDMLSRRLERQGHRSILAENGLEALELLRAHDFDLILLDIMMPRMNGYELLEHIRADTALRHIPVIMISAVDDLDSVVKCVEMGAEDYLFKPFNPILLKARIGASLEKKRLRDQEQRYRLGALPPIIADRLRRGETIAEQYPDALVVCAGVSGLEAQPPPQAAAQLAHLLNAFDELAALHGLYGLRPPGSLYVAAGGVPLPQPNAADAAAAFIQGAAQEVAALPGLDVCFGIHAGTACGAVFQITGFPSYHLWGEAVELADRLRMAAPPGGALASAAAAIRLERHFSFADGGTVTGVRTYSIV